MRPNSNNGLMSPGGTVRRGFGIPQEASAMQQQQQRQQIAELLSIRCQEGDQAACIELSSALGLSASTGGARGAKQKERLNKINEIGQYTPIPYGTKKPQTSIEASSDNSVRSYYSNAEIDAMNAKLEEETIDKVVNADLGCRKVVVDGKSELRCADGGMIEESLLVPPEMGSMDTNMGMEEEDEFLPFTELLGEEGYAEFEKARLDYPIVAEIARMAMKTSDGYVEGEGGPKDDLVPARLSDGEFVLTKEAVDMIGVDKLEKLNELAAQGAASYN